MGWQPNCSPCSRSADIATRRQSDRNARAILRLGDEGREEQKAIPCRHQTKLQYQREAPAESKRSNPKRRRQQQSPLLSMNYSTVQSSSSKSTLGPASQAIAAAAQKNRSRLPPVFPCILSPTGLALPRLKRPEMGQKRCCWVLYLFGWILGQEKKENEGLQTAVPHHAVCPTISREIALKTFYSPHFVIRLSQQGKQENARPHDQCENKSPAAA